MKHLLNYGGKEIRSVVEDDDLWFVAHDVCRILDIEFTQTRRLYGDEKGLRLTHTPGGKQKMLYVNEYGLYNLILGSRKPEAKQFKRWVTHEVLPAIRKTGSYSTSKYLTVCPRASEAEEVFEVLKKRALAFLEVLEIYDTAKIMDGSCRSGVGNTLQLMAFQLSSDANQLSKM